MRFERPHSRLKLTLVTLAGLIIIGALAFGVWQLSHSTDPNAGSAMAFAIGYVIVAVIVLILYHADQRELRCQPRTTLNLHMTRREWRKLGMSKSEARQMTRL